MKLLFLAFVFLQVLLTDAQNCPNGYFYQSDLGACLMYTTMDATNWSTASSYCRQNQGNLISIHNTIQNNILAQLQRNIAGSDAEFWLGATLSTNGMWSWSDGTPFDYQQFQSSERGNNAILDSRDRLWKIRGLSEARNFFCEAPLAPTTLQPVTTQSPLVCLPVEQQPLYNCKNGWQYSLDTGYQYLVIYDTNYDDAQVACQAQGAQLASIHSQAENDFITSLCCENGCVFRAHDSDAYGWYLTGGFQVLPMQFQAFNEFFKKMDPINGLMVLRLSFREIFVMIVVAVRGSLLLSPILAQESAPYSAPSLPLGTVEPDPSAGAPLVRGNVNITVEVVNETREIFLNSKGLPIRQVKVNGYEVSWEEANPDLLNLHSNFLLSKVARHYIWIEFDVIDSNLDLNFMKVGIQRDSYNDTDGGVRYYVSTQGEEFGAHLYVPCFDDISMKSEWLLTIKHPKSYKALSNGKLLSRIHAIDGYAISEFEKTPKMSSYLFTFCLSEFKSLTTKATNGIPLTIYMKEPEFTKNGSSGLRHLTESFNFLNSVLRPAYPLQKMDIIAVPWEDWAMENWGLITTGSDGMDLSTTQHELAHQWFGNLVTAKSWDQYWLNEGFATYWQFQNFPNETTDIVLIRDSIFEEDMLENALPIVAAKRNLIQAEWSRYRKGGMLLFMIDALIGKQNLWNIMNEYLEANAYKSVVTAQFFASFKTFFQAQHGELAKINITQFGYDWTHQAGYPIVSISRNGENYILTQKSSSGKGSVKRNTSNLARLLLDHSKQSHERWDIPLFIQEDLVCSEKNYSIKVFPKESENLELPVSSLPKSPNFNIGYGYYKVELDEDLFDERVEQFEKKPTNCDSSSHYRFLVDGTMKENKNIRDKSTNLLKKHFPKSQEKQFTHKSQKAQPRMRIF